MDYLLVLFVQAIETVDRRRLLNAPGTAPPVN
jgi:hypothetical protein